MVQLEVTVGRVASGPLASGKSLGVTGATICGSKTSVRSSDLPLWQVTVASHTADCYPQPRFIEPSPLDRLRFVLSGVHPMCKRLAVVSAVFAVSLLAGTPSVWAQRTPVLQPTVFAIRDARVVPEPGKLLAKATVVIRDGLIEEVGPDAKVPVDALVMDGKGLTVYPGFLDTLSNWGFDPALRRSESGSPAPEDYASEALATTKPDNRKGMTPEFQVSTAL